MNVDSLDREEEPYFSDAIDSDLEAELYGKLHHEPNSECCGEDIPNSDVQTEEKFSAQNLHVPKIVANKRIFLSAALQNRAIHSGKRLPAVQVGSDFGKIQCIKDIYSDDQQYKRVERKEYFTGKRNSWHDADSTCHRKKRKHSPPLIDISESPPKLSNFLVERSTGRDEDPASCKKRHQTSNLNKQSKQQDVITVIDSDEVQEILVTPKDSTTGSDSTINISSSSDEDITNEGTATDIHLNINGFKHSPRADFDLEKELNSLPGNPNLWRIHVKDKFPNAYRKSYKYQLESRLQRINCLNCRERGHLSRNCTKQRRLDVCYLCGTTGHAASCCYQPACMKCMTIGHRVEQCNWKDKFIVKKCLVCNMKGHLTQQCPDNWRKYHMTITTGPIRMHSESFSVPKAPYCFNCGACGHLGHECLKKRMKSYIYPHLPWVVSYSQESDEKPSGSFDQSKRDRENYHRTLYDKKVKSTASSNRRHMKLMKSKVGAKMKVGSQAMKYKNRKNKAQGQSGESFKKTFVKNGQVCFPRTAGIKSKPFKAKKILSKNAKKKMNRAAFAPVPMLNDINEEI